MSRTNPISTGGSSTRRAAAPIGIRGSATIVTPSRPCGTPRRSTGFWAPVLGLSIVAGQVAQEPDQHRAQDRLPPPDREETRRAQDQPRGRRTARPAGPTAVLGAARAGAAPGPEPGLPPLLRPLLRRARLPPLRAPLGRQRRSRRRGREPPQLDGPARARRAGRGAHALQARLGGPPPSVHRGEDDRGRVRPRRDVLQGVPGLARLVPPRRGLLALLPARPLRSRRPGLRPPDAPLRRPLYE